MRSRIHLVVVGIVIFAFTLTSCGIRADPVPRDIDPSHQDELNGK